MKNSLFVLFLLISSSFFAQEIDYRKIPKELNSVWNDFSLALKNNDKEKIEALSLNCIDCMVCETNENESSALISMKTFLEENYAQVLSRAVRERSQDSTKLFFVAHEKVKTSDLKNCMRSSIKSKRAKHFEVLITVTDPSDKFEGAQLGLNFIETKNGFRLYALYSIP